MKILCISPHTDDAELGAGGFISKSIQQGDTVDHLILSNAVKSLPKGLASDTLINEANNAAAKIGFSNLRLENFPVRDFPGVRQDILELFYAISRKKTYDLVLIPSAYDIHQDHETTHKEAVRAFKNSSIYGYELPWNNFSFQNNGYINLSEQNVEDKLNAVNCYQSQKHRAYMQPDYLRSLAMVRGSQIGTKYAETYEIIRLIS